MKKKNEYFPKEEFFEEIVKFRKVYDNPKTRDEALPSERAGMILLELGNRLLTNPKFRNYEHHLKEDMLSRGIMKSMRGMQLYKLECGPSKTFSYFTRIMYLSCLDVIGAHYKQINIKNKLIQKMKADALEYVPIGEWKDDIFSSGKYRIEDEQ